MINNKKYYFYFSLTVVGVFAFYNIFKILQNPAGGAHLWRQADSLAMVWNYKLFPISFWQPETFNLLSESGKGVAEFPIFYYWAAQFNLPEIALRCIHFIILIGGIVSVFKLAVFYLRDLFFALFATLLFTSSPFIIYYGTSFIIDMPAFCFTIMAWSIFISQNDKKYALALSLFLFSFSTLLKASFALNFILLFYLLNEQKKINLKSILLGIFFILFPILWYLYAKWFNQINHNNYLFLSIQTIFAMSLFDIGLAAWRIVMSWSETYFWRPTSIALIISLFFIFRNKPYSSLTRMIIGTIFLDIIFAILFWNKLTVHEYYYAFFFVSVVFVIIGFSQLLQQINQQKIVKIIALLFLIVNLFYCKNYIVEKQKVQRIDAILLSNEFQKFLVENNCTLDKIVFCYDDESVNQMLYAIKRKGITKYNKDWESSIEKNKIDFILIKNTSYNNINIKGARLINFKNYFLIPLKNTK